MEYHLSIAQELNINPSQVQDVITLLNDGNTIPFIARYRKEQTGSLDEVQLRDIRDQYTYLQELDDRRKSILQSIDEQGKLTDLLKSKIEAVKTKQALEDLYLPYKRKRRTRATIAKEKGLEPLALLIKEQNSFDEWVTQFLSENKSEEEFTTESILSGARDIIAEWITEDVDLKESIREMSWSNGSLSSKVRKGFKDQKTKFEIYYEFSENLSTIPAHRILAIRRGEEEGILRVSVDVPVDAILEIMKKYWIDFSKKNQQELELAIEDSYQRLISSSVEVELRMKLKKSADEESISIFSENLRNLLLAPLGGDHTIISLDPGFRTGSKWVVLDETGKFFEHGTIFPVEPQKQVNQAQAIFKKLIQKYPVKYICIGNGTASREIHQFVRDFLTQENRTDIQPIIVNESGASIYSASDIAREEFPDLDLTYRGSISIGRRFQDPLAELVKIDPKSIGVGQYQHDVNQSRLKKSLDETVESCVNHVGVNLNTASSSLLSYVSGVSKTLTKNIVAYREENGAFKERKQLLKIPRFGAKAFEQSAGFFRIQGGKNPLDQSTVHPENYPVVLKMAKDLKLSIEQLLQNEDALQKIQISDYVTEKIGILTLKDIINELKKPGRDPREQFVGAKFEEGIQEISDLYEGLCLEGTITNLTKFGAFVDIGVHQDGLVHVSEMANRFIRDPSEVCKVGDIVKVKVMSVETERKRIALSIKQADGNDSQNKHQSTEKTNSGNFPKKSKKKEEPKKTTTGNFTTDLDALAKKFQS